MRTNAILGALLLSACTGSLWVERPAGSREAVPEPAVAIEPPRVTIREPIGDTVYVEDGPFPFAIDVANASSVAHIALSVGGEVVSESEQLGRDELGVTIDPVALLATGEVSHVVLSVRTVDLAGGHDEVVRGVTVRHRERWFANEDETTFAPAIAPDGAIALATSDRLVVLEADGTERCHAAGAGASAPPAYLPGRGTVLWSTIEATRIVSLADCTVAWQQAASAGDFVVATVHDDARVHATTFFGSLLTFAFDGSDLHTISLADAAGAAAGALEMGRGLSLGPDGTLWAAGSPSTASGVIFAVARDGSVRALEMPAPIENGILATRDGVYAGGVDGRLYKVDRDLRRAWREEPLLSEGHPIECTPVELDDRRIATCDGAGRVVAVFTADGTIAWEYDASAGRVPYRLIGEGGLSRGGAGGGLLALGDRLGMLHVLGAEGQLRWRVQVTRTPAAIVDRPAMDDSNAYVVTEAGLLVAYAL